MRSLRSTMRRVGVVRGAHVKRTDAAVVVRTTRITGTGLAARNRSARVPAARRLASLQGPPAGQHRHVSPGRRDRRRRAGSRRFNAQLLNVQRPKANAQSPKALRPAPNLQSSPARGAAGVVELIIGGARRVSHVGLPTQCGWRDSVGPRMRGMLVARRSRAGTARSGARFREAGTRPALMRSLRSTTRRVGVVRAARVKRTDAAVVIRTTRITRTGLAARNRSARVPAARRLASLQGPPAGQHRHVSPGRRDRRRRAGSRRSTPNYSTPNAQRPTPNTQSPTPNAQSPIEPGARGAAGVVNLIIGGARRVSHDVLPALQNAQGGPVAASSS